MALGKTVSYTPFEETSFGYGSNEIATALSSDFPNADDIVKVVIEHSTGNWDASGHIKTPTSSSAIAVYHKQQKMWIVKGERDDVDAVLSELTLFPADHYDARTWEPTETKTNQILGVYANEEPPEISDTVFTLRVYDGSTSVSTNTVTFEASNTYGNQRPYFSVEPTTEDLNTTEHGTVAGGLVDLGTISHGTDTENVRVSCSFHNIVDENTIFSNPYDGGGLGVFTSDDNIFLGDKKASPRNFTDARFDFTGSVAEAQAYLDNIRYYDAGNDSTFVMKIKVSDGVVGSEINKYCYFSNSAITVSTLPDQSFYEDTFDAWIDFGIVTFGNVQPEVTQFSATVTFDATGHSGISHGTFGTGTYVDGQPLTTTRSTLAELQEDLRLLEIYVLQDFDSDYTLTVDFTFSNPTIGTSYTAAQQTVNVSGIPTEELSNPTTTHTWKEDMWYEFPSSKTPQIIHPRNEQFDIIFTLSDADAGIIWRHGNSAFITSAYGTSGQYKLQGSRDDINVALQNLYFKPNADYDDNFTISFTLDRTSGDLTHTTQQTGSFTMNAIATSEISFPLERPHITWKNNVSTEFASGLQITDLADTLVGSPTFASTYTVKILLRQLHDDGASGFQFENGVLKIDDEYADLLDEITGNRSNEITITGTKSIVNVVLRFLTFIPDPLYAERNRHYAVYQVTRDSDAKVIHNYQPSVLTWIDDADIDEDGYSVNTQLFDWTEDSVLTFDTEFRITEALSENEDYTPANGYDSWLYSWYKVTIRGKYWDGSAAQELSDIHFNTAIVPNDNLYVEGQGTVSNPLILKGSKSELNKAFAAMKLIPITADFTSAPSDNGQFWFEHKLERIRDNSNMINYNENLGRFNAATNTPEYLETWTNVEYTEDIKAQYIFSHLEDVIKDGAGDLHDVTYDVKIRLANETTGKFESYVDEGYLLDDELNIFVNDYEVRIVGSKSDVNQAIKNIQFTPYADVSDNVDIHYTQIRTHYNATATHVDDAVVTTMIGIDTPEYVMGTANNNIQYFVEDKFNLGLNLTMLDTGDEPMISVYIPDTPDTIIQSRPGEAVNYQTLTPRLLTENVRLTYSAPITIVDTYENGGESLYKVVFDGGSLFTSKNEDLTTLGASLNITDTGWLNKATLNSILANGIYATGVNDENDNIPNDQQTFDVTFTVYRKDATGVETQLSGHRSLTYVFVSGLAAYLNSTIRLDERATMTWSAGSVIDFRYSNGLSRNDEELYGRMVHSDYDFGGTSNHFNVPELRVVNHNGNDVLAYDGFHNRAGLGFRVFPQDSQGNSDRYGNFFELDETFAYYNYPSENGNSYEVRTQMQFRVYNKWGIVLIEGDRRTNYRLDWEADQGKSYLYARKYFEAGGSPD